MQGSATQSARSAAAEGYGLAQYGADWPAAEAVVVLVHGRDGTPDEMAGMLDDSMLGHLRVLAPYTEEKSWYPGRYDAPFAENKPYLARALDQLSAAMDVAGENGFGPGRVLLAGFSQGACLVTEYLLDGRARPGAAGICTGTALALKERSLAQQNLEALPIVLSGGSGDAWLPLTDFMATESVLSSMGADVHMELFPDADHAVRPAEIALLGELAGRLTP
ncbi:alpha/beta hydrolase [Pseudoroseicyclus sp. H15]